MADLSTGVYEAVTESFGSNRVRIALVVIGVLAAMVLFFSLGGEDGDESKRPGAGLSPRGSSERAEIPARDLDTNAGSAAGNTERFSNPGADPGRFSSRGTEGSEATSGRDDSGGAGLEGDRVGDSQRRRDSDRDFDRGDRDAERIRRETARLRAIQDVTAGIRAAQANPGAAPEMVAEFRRQLPVPVELEDASRQVNLTPPEILETLRASNEVPPEIVRAMAEAEANGTSEELRAFMMGEDAPSRDE